MQTQQIAKPILKQNQLLQVDYFTSTVVKASRQNFQGWDSVMKISKEQEKLYRYLEQEDLHGWKYFHFKKRVNQKYFGKELPEDYLNTTIEETLKGDQFLYTPRFNKMSSSVMGNSIVPMDSQAGSFITNYDSWKERLSLSKEFKPQKYKSSKYSTLRATSSNTKRPNRSVCFSPSPQIFSTIQQNQLNISSSIYPRSSRRSINQSFSTIKSRPVSQKVTRRSQKLKQIITKGINPESNPKNIRNRLSTLTQQEQQNKKILKTERKSILDIISKQKLYKFLAQSKSIDPKRKGIFTLDDLTDFEKFNLTFPKYMKLKTKAKIDKYAFQNLVKEKHNNLQKFQKFILDQFSIQTDSKRKLQRVFERIVWQFNRAQRLKEIQKR